MKHNDGQDLTAETGELAAGIWQDLFQTTQAPLFIEDLTDVRPLIEQAVAATQGRDLRSWLDAHPEFVGRVIASIRIVDVNEDAVTLNAAASREELLVSLEKLVLPETLEAFKDFICAIAEDRGYYEGECRYRALDGREYQTLNRAWLPKSGDAQQLMTIVTVDVTDLKLAEQALATSEERYRLLIEAAQDIVIRHELSGRITFVNRAGTEMLGRPREQVIGLSCEHLYTAESYAKALQIRADRSVAGAGGQQMVLFEAELRRADGGVVPVEINSTLLAGTAAGRDEPQVLLVARDITQRRAMQAETTRREASLREAQRLESLGALAGGIAHQFNNLLVAIMGNAELLVGDENLEDGQREQLQAVLAAGNQAAILCRQMRAYAGAQPLTAEQLDLTAVVEDMKGLIHVSAGGDAHLHYDLSGGLPAILMDPGQVRQVIMSIVVNAVEALDKEGGEIMVRTGCGLPDPEPGACWFGSERPPTSPQVYCEVRDSGCGMDSGTVDRMFEPFFSRKFAGRGLGMSAALGIVRGHGGCFRVRSEPKGGTSVSFWLPASPPARQHPTGDHGTDPDRGVALKGRTVLVVDDNAKVRAVGESFLRRLGCRVLSAADGYDAVQIFGQRYREVDAIMLDYTMPGLDGESTARRLRVIKPDVPLLLTSGHDESGTWAHMSDLGRGEYLAKPYSLSQLRKALQDVLS